MPTRAEMIHELHRVAALPPSSGRHAAAKANALRQLLRLEGEWALTDPEQDLWDANRDPAELVTERYWHPDAEGLFAELDAADTVATPRRQSDTWRRCVPRRTVAVGPKRVV